MTELFPGTGDPPRGVGEPGAKGIPGIPPPEVNDFAVKIGTVNGTGSASANGLLMQAIFRMGIPVTGKNVFPSNIQGLPTWYEVRVSGKGHTARRARFDLVVAMNPETYPRDIREVGKGGYLLYDSSWPLSKALLEEDITFLGVPLGEMCVRTFSGDRVRTLMKNITYVGALAAFLSIDLDIIQRMLEETFARKKALIDSNRTAIRLGYDYAMEHFECPLPFHLAKLDETADHILIDGNTAAALGCVYAGATVGAWYPITPSTSLMDAFNGFCERYRIDDEGRRRFCIIQAEDELAAAGIAIGAGWAGARAFTPTSGPGISLMSEFIGFAYYAEVPVVLFDVQRTGPSTGMPTRTQQGDLMMVAYASHGDTKHIALFPADPWECFHMAVKAFDLAERYQTPVFVVSDLDIGMNDWMCRRLRWDDDYRPDRGKVLTSEELEEIQAYYRYLATEEDAVAPRTLPGVHPKGAYFTRGSGHDHYGRYTEDAEEYTGVVDRIARKIEGAAEAAPGPEVILAKAPATVGIVSVGGCHAAILEALDELEEEGLLLDYMRVRAFPFAQAVRDFLEGHERIVVVEQNRDGQLRSLLILDAGGLPDRLLSVRQYGGLPLSAHHVVEGVRRELGASPLRHPRGADTQVEAASAVRTES